MASEPVEITDREIAEFHQGRVCLETSDNYRTVSIQYNGKWIAVDMPVDAQRQLLRLLVTAKTRREHDAPGDAACEVLNGHGSSPRGGCS